MTPQQYARRHHQRFVQELKALIRFPSVSAQPRHRQDVIACARHLTEHFRKLGLQTEYQRTDGNPILVARAAAADPRAPTVIVYGHYDVQPPDPLKEWKTPPFEPVIRAGRLFGRGTSDNKGQFFAHVKAVESYLKSGTPLPVHVIFLIEGEEETGGESLAAFVEKHASQLRTDYAVISDTAMFLPGYPTITYGVRGIAAIEVRVHGPSRDLHSGVFGGSVSNPVTALVRLLATCVDAHGRVSIPGFYEDARPLSRWERQQFARLPFDESAYVRFLGVPAVAGEKGFSTLERRWARPTFEINGIFGGYSGDGSKTIIPAWAGAKITCRLVPDQDPQKVVRQTVHHLRRNCPRSVRLAISPAHGYPPFLQSPSGPGVRAAARALKKAFGSDPVFAREGGSLPVLDLLKRRLGAEILLIGLGLPDDNWHSPNEKMSLSNFQRGILMSGFLLQELGTTAKVDKSPARP